MNTRKDYTRIDIDAVLRRRLPRYYRWIPKPLISLVKRIICQDELNRQLEINAGKNGADFCRGVIEDLEVSYTLTGEENLPAADDRRKIFVCNHPLGGLDGMVMIDMIARRYGSPLFFVVNDLLSVVSPLNDIFLPVNKHGRQSRQATLTLDEAFDSNHPVIMFPAGLVSRRSSTGIGDLVWNKMFVNRAIRHQRDIVPVYFEGRNSSFFYNFARLRVALGLKFNYEMICLPSEVFKSRGKQFVLHIGRQIAWTSLKGGAMAQSTASEIRTLVYNLKRKVSA